MLNRSRRSSRPISLANGRSALLIAGFLATAVMLAACASDDGRTLRSPTEPPPTSEPPPEEPFVFPDPDSFNTDSLNTDGTESDPPEPAGGAEFELFAPFLDSTEIDLRYTCDGPDLSPALAWIGIPDGVVELAISVVDDTADGWVHWIVVGIDPSITASPEGGIPAGAATLRNDFGTIGWSGPCPPLGSPHRYRFTLHAPSDPYDADPEAAPAQIVAELDALSWELASVTGTYTR